MPRIKILDEAEGGGVFDIEGDSFLIGREHDCHLRIVDTRISRHHAVIELIDDDWLVIDLASTNGITVNGEVRTRCRLRNGDVICVGPVRFAFFDDELNRPNVVVGSVRTSEVLASRHIDPDGAERLKTVLEIATIFGPFGRSDALLRRIGEHVVSLFRPTLCIVKVSQTRWAFEAKGSRPSRLSEQVLARIEERSEAVLYGRAMETPLVQIALDDLEHTSKDDESGTVKSDQTGGRLSAMGTPILQAGRFIGLVYVEISGDEASEYTRDDLFLLLGVARIIGSTALGQPEIDLPATTAPPPADLGDDRIAALVGAARRSNPPRLVDRCLLAIVDRMREQMTVDDLAKAVHVSRRSLQREMKRALDCGPSEVIWAVKMYCARQLLETGEFRVSEVADKVGFESPEHFSKRFKQYYRATPSAVKRLKRQIALD